MIVVLFLCMCLNFVRSMNWFSIPANIVWISIDDSVIQCLNYGYWLEQLFSFERSLEPLFLSEHLNFHRWIEPLTECLNFAQWLEPLFLSECLNFDRWIESLFPRNWWLVPLFLSKRLNFDRWFESLFPRNWWLVPLFLSKRLNFYRWIESIFPKIVDLYRYSWANVWIFIDDLIQYSREIVDLSERLNFDRWFEPNVWILIDHWIESVFPRQFWFDLVVDLHSYSRANVWSSNPVTFVWLNFVTVVMFSPRMCFRINFVTVLHFPLHLSSEYFRRFCSFRYLAKSRKLNYALPKTCLRTCFRLTFVNWQSRGIWSMRFRSLDFVHVFRINFGCFFRGGMLCFRSIASELISWFCFVRSSVLIARSPSRELSRKKNNSALQFLGKRTIARSKFSENTTKTQSKRFYF